MKENIYTRKREYIYLYIYIYIFIKKIMSHLYHCAKNRLVKPFLVGQKWDRNGTMEQKLFQKGKYGKKRT